MKKTNILYWIFTGLLATMMLLSSIPDVLMSKEAVEFMDNHLHYPHYFTPFIGVAKILGVIALLTPGFPRLKEWAYAGFVFDLTGAIYSGLAVGDPLVQWLPLLIGHVFILISYVLHHKRLHAQSMTTSSYNLAAQ